MRALDIEHLRYGSNFIARQRRRVGDLGEKVAKVFGAATFGARLRTNLDPTTSVA